MRWVVKHKLYHHLDIVRIDCGLPFIVGAHFFERARQRSLEHWIQERKGYLVTIKVPEKVIDPKLIVQELDKPYDTAAALSKVHERIFGDWNGHTGNHSVKKNFCFELAARIWEKENAYMAGIIDFEF